MSSYWLKNWNCNFTWTKLVWHWKADRTHPWTSFNILAFGEHVVPRERSSLALELPRRPCFCVDVFIPPHCSVYLENKAKHGDVMQSCASNTWHSYRKDWWRILCRGKMLQMWMKCSGSRGCVSWNAAALLFMEGTAVSASVISDNSSIAAGSPDTLCPNIVLISWSPTSLRPT